MTEGSDKKVLVVEDDEDLVALVSMLLLEDGHRVETAGNGREALDALDRGMPDLILLDMKMPVMNGVEFARAFRSRFDDRPPIVVLTASADAERRAHDVGAAGWLGKPFDPDELLAKVRSILSRAS